MNQLPRILIIDDVFGRHPNRSNNLREDLCFRLGLREITLAESSEEILDPIADAVFLPGQIEDSGFVHNDLYGTLQKIKEGWLQHPRWSLLLLDMHFKTGIINKSGDVIGSVEDRDPNKYFGLTLLENIVNDQQFEDLPIVILSAMARNEIEERFAERGVFDFVDKNELTKERLNELIFNYGLYPDEKIVGTSIELLKSLRSARLRSRSGADNILILGESGTGKELLAEYIYRNSMRKGKFITFFSQGIPEALIEDRLFGHVQGAFTGAKENVKGAVELAEGGSLFIDEFGDIPGNLQHKLLRLLDKNTREFQRLGSNQISIADIQIIMATNKLNLMASNDFHKDLLYRAKIGKAIHLSPLRDRKEDIPLLSNYFLKIFEKKYNAQKRNISDESIKSLMDYEWTGNIRELELIIEEAVYNFPGIKILTKQHLYFDKYKKMTSKSLAISQNTKTNKISISSNICLEQLLEVVEDFNLNSLPPLEWKGKLGIIENTFGRFLTKCLIISLNTTKKVSLEYPEGKISIVAAIKFLSGDDTITAIKSADYIKRIIKFSKGSISDLIDTEPLKSALKTVNKIRK